MVHLSVAIGRFFEALLYAMFSAAFWVMAEIAAGIAVLVIVVLLMRRLLRGGRRER